MLTDSLLISCISAYNPWSRMELQKMPHLHTPGARGSCGDGQQPPHGQKAWRNTGANTTSPQTKKGKHGGLYQGRGEDLCNSDGIRLNLQEGKIRHNEFNFMKNAVIVEEEILRTSWGRQWLCPRVTEVSKRRQGLATSPRERGQGVLGALALGVVFCGEM